jgi:acyl transferase domain-containing protein
MSDSNPGLEGIAIIGMAGRFPGAATVDAFWANLEAGVESITFFSEQEVEARDSFARSGRADYIRARGVLKDVDLFDAAFFGYSPKEAEVMDPQHRIFLECAWEAMEDAGYDSEQVAGPIGVFAGQSLNTYLLANLCAHRGFIDEVTGAFQVGAYTVVLGNDKDYLTTRVCYKLNLRGPGVTVQSACSTSLVAISQACQSLLTFQTDMALAGGISISFPQKRGYLYQEGGMVSADGHCRSFDAAAGGTVFASGAAVVLLKRLEDAVADRDHVYAVIKSTALNNDGSLKVGYMAPSVERQAEVIATAHALAGISADDVGYVEAHGTGTPLGDPIEVEALTRAFRATTQAKGFCALGALKTNVGHMESAAGAAGLIKAALMLERRVMPASLHFTRPNAKIDFTQTPFFVNTERREWKSKSPRRAGVSSFGVGGTNAHAVLEEAPAAPRSQHPRPFQPLVLSARSEAALDAAASRLAEHLKAHPDLALGDVAFTLQLGRRPFAVRRALACKDLPDAVVALGSGRGSRANAAPREPPVAFLFPGQGAQELGMGAQLYRTEPVFRAEIDACCERLKPELGFDLRERVFQDAQRNDALEAALQQTSVTQPALFTIEYALARLWASWGVSPAAMIGHSVGEYVAACLAGVFSLEDGLSLVAARGRLIQALPPGAMLSIRLGEDEVRPLLGADLDLAASNGPVLCVASGSMEAIARLEESLTQRGTVHRRLKTSHAFHSRMMDPVLGPFTERVRKVLLSSPKIPFISSVTGTWITETEATDPQYWARHVRQTVAFAKGVRELQQAPERVLLEVGPGKTLATLARQSQPATPPQDVVTSLAELNPPGDERQAILQALGRLWVNGVKPDWNALHREATPGRVRLPTYPFERKRFWVDPPPASASGAAVEPAAAHAAPQDGELQRILQDQLQLMEQQLLILGETAPGDGDPSAS